MSANMVARREPYISWFDISILLPLSLFFSNWSRRANILAIFEISTLTENQNFYAVDNERRFCIAILILLIVT